MGLQSIHYSLYKILYAFITNKRFSNLDSYDNTKKQHCFNAYFSFKI